MNLYLNTPLSEIIPPVEHKRSNQHLKTFHTANEMALIDSIISRMMVDACNVFGANLDSFKSKSRRREVVMSRQVVCYLLWNFTRLSLAQIGVVVGKYHATVLHSNRTIEDLLETDRPFRLLYVEEFERYQNELALIGK